MGLGGYVLTESQTWQEIFSYAPNSGVVLAVLAGLITFMIGFFSCCCASQKSQSMLSTYAIAVGVVVIIEVAAAVLLLIYLERVIYLSSLQIIAGTPLV